MRDASTSNQTETDETSVANREGGKRSLVSLVVPVYNEEAVIRVFYDRTTEIVGGEPSIDHEIIFIDDGSADASYSILREIADNDPQVRVIKLSRNFGHQLAITAGIDTAIGDAVVVIDADLQDPPEVIIRMIERWRDGYDVVYAVRKQRDGESFLKLLTAKWFYRILNKLTDANIPKDVGDFRLMSRRAADELQNIREHDRFVRGLVSWIGFRQTGLEYQRDRRYAGVTKFSWTKMIAFAFDAITSFSRTPLRFATWLGFGASIMAFVYLCSVFVQWFMGVTVAGWATTIVIMLFLGGVQLICLGIIGEYVGRSYMELKRRPLYVIDHIYTSDNRVDQS